MATKRIRSTSKTLSPYITPAAIEKYLTKSEIRREYTTIRDIYQKRFKRLEAAGIENQSELYNQWHNNQYNGIPQIKDLKGNQLEYLLAAMKRQLTFKTGTVKGTREAQRRRAEALSKAHYDITEADIPDFKRFMQRYKNEKLDHVIGSPIVVEMYETYKDEYTRDFILDHWEVFKKHLHDPEKSGLYEDIEKLRI